MQLLIQNFWVNLINHIQCIIQDNHDIGQLFNVDNIFRYVNVNIKIQKCSIKMCNIIFKTKLRNRV